MKTNRILLAALGLGVTLSTLVNCSSDSSSSNSLPPIGGYNNSNEVAATDLVAYWPLNGDGKESKSNTSPSDTQNVTWVTGAKGQAASFNLGWLKYPSIANLTAINENISISAWIKISNTKLVDGGSSQISPIFTLTNPNEQIGNVALFGNTHGLVSSDSIQLKTEFKVKRADGTTFGGDCVNMTKMESWMISDNAAGATPAHAAFANKIGGQWAHVVFVYNTAGGKTVCNMYSNGVKISNPQWEERKDGGASVSMPFNQFTPSYPIIGALRTVADGTNTDAWNAALKGQVDEIRVYKKALTVSEVGALYELEKAGR